MTVEEMIADMSKNTHFDISGPEIGIAETLGNKRQQRIGSGGGWTVDATFYYIQNGFAVQREESYSSYDLDTTIRLCYDEWKQLHGMRG